MEVRHAVRRALHATVLPPRQPCLFNRSNPTPLSWRTAFPYRRLSTIPNRPDFKTATQETTTTATTPVPPPPPPPASSSAAEQTSTTAQWPTRRTIPPTPSKFGGSSGEGGASSTLLPWINTDAQSSRSGRAGARLTSRLGIPAKGFNLANAIPSAVSRGMGAENPTVASMLGSDFMDRNYRNKVKLRLSPVVGRTIPVRHESQVQRSLIQLNMLCRQNKINREFNLQRFHERPGKKRKRLRSERWRARFKDGFSATCSRVIELTKQGW